MLLSSNSKSCVILSQRDTFIHSVDEEANKCMECFKEIKEIHIKYFAVVWSQQSYHFPNKKIFCGTSSRLQFSSYHRCETKGICPELQHDTMRHLAVILNFCNTKQPIYWMQQEKYSDIPELPQHFFWIQTLQMCSQKKRVKMSHSVCPTPH